jgi:large subunit ribosomal protein L6
MSGIGKKPVEIPKGVETAFKDGRLSVSGPKGRIEKPVDSRIQVKIEGGRITFERPSDDSDIKALQGLYRAFAIKMFKGVTQGFEIVLELSGVGYRAALQGKALSLTLGFSHPVEIAPPEGISFAVEGQNKVKVAGIDWEKVGQVAANVRSIRPVEPYKGKGIKYLGEIVKRKAGKAAKAAGAAGG